MPRLTTKQRKSRQGGRKRLTTKQRNSRRLRKQKWSKQWKSNMRKSGKRFPRWAGSWSRFKRTGAYKMRNKKRTPLSAYGTIMHPMSGTLVPFIKT